MTSTVLTGADAFMQDFEKAAMQATDSIVVQAMTFEGDSAGEQLIDILLRSPAKDKRLLVDSYSKAVINDSFIIGLKYLKDRDFRKEVKNTSQILKRAQENGIGVRFTNSLGFLMTRYPLRNHKKLVVVDGRKSYLGGINFSDHNFEWYDMMIGIDDADLGACIVEDFNNTWEGKNQSAVRNLKDADVYFFNGVKSKALYDVLFSKIEQAQESIKVISPYVSNPLLSVLERAGNNGVDVSIVSPAENNKGIFKDILLAELHKGYFRMLQYPGMSHLKAILIDGESLLFGSSNYDIVSYYWEQEIVLESRDKGLIEDFKRSILEPAEEQAIELQPSGSTWNFSSLVMKALEGFCSLTSRSLLRPH